MANNAIESNEFAALCIAAHRLLRGGFSPRNVRGDFRRRLHRVETLAVGMKSQRVIDGIACRGLALPAIIPWQKKKAESKSESKDDRQEGHGEKPPGMHGTVFPAHRRISWVRECAGAS